MQETTLFDLCSVEGCCLMVKNKSRQLCDPHYKRLWRYGDPLAGGPMRPNARAGKPVQDFPDGTRICNACSERLPIGSFHKDANATGGRRSRCAACHSADAREWHDQNRDRIKARMKAYRQANTDVVRSQDSLRYQRDRDKRIALAIEATHRRRLRMQAGEYDRTVTRAALQKQYGDLCFYCHRQMDFGRYTHTTKPQDLATIEHVWPISKGGGHTWDNVVLACLDCNLSKQARTPDEWVPLGQDVQRL